MSRRKPLVKEGLHCSVLGIKGEKGLKAAMESFETIFLLETTWVVTNVRGEYCDLTEVLVVEIPEDIEVIEDVVKTKQPIKSDGGSSSYYDLPIPKWLLDKLIERQESTGQAFIKTEECIETFFDNDFDYGNMFKSQVRSYGTEQGEGKAGNNCSYEMSKVKYSADKIIELSERRKDAK